MSPEALAAWLPGQFARYVEERVHAGEAPDAARVMADAQRAELFPGDAPAEGQHVMHLRVDDETVGVLWMGRPLGGGSDWYVFFVGVDEARRGRGLGRVAMLEAERWTRARGGTRIVLNVFGPNQVARNLYDSLGYRPLQTYVQRELGDTLP
jgi:ribosomal protein S18 acetylase RimI-like enzyme